ncbi:hypothetical protein DAI22_11g159250 [Oryza sativa Japonica Group]|nr:hypothetical protein DAI22_11g159250 [Oryza sativa Japonica Group]
MPQLPATGQIDLPASVISPSNSSHVRDRDELTAVGRDRSTGVSDITGGRETHWKQPSSKPSSSRQATPAACCAALRLLPRGHQPCARAAARRPLPLAACALSALPLALCGCAAAAIARRPQLPRGRNRTPPQRHEKSPQGKG